MGVGPDVRHAMTDYDGLLSRGYDRELARTKVADKIDEVVCSWEKTKHL